MQTLLQVFHVLLAAAMIALILVQRGAGASAGASFGAGASATVFGSRGAGSFLTHATAVTATGFFLVSFIMAVLAGRTAVPVDEDDLGVMSRVTPAVEQPADAEVPAGDVPAPVAGDVPVAEPLPEADVPAMPAETQDKAAGEGVEVAPAEAAPEKLPPAEDGGSPPKQ